MFSPISFNPAPTCSPRLDSQASEQVNSRSKRSLDDIAPDNSIIDSEHGADSDRKRNRGGVDGLGGGYLL